MQVVPGLSSAQTVPATAVPAAAGRKRNLWILDGWRDLILYVCTPLLLVPIFIAAQGLWAAEDIYLFVAAFGAMGHHLPGMIRAYGDRALFQRFRWRFHFRADFPRCGLCGFFLVGPKRHCPGRVCLGRLAWNDANVWFLPHLRRESRLVR